MRLLHELPGLLVVQLRQPRPEVDAEAEVAGCRAQEVHLGRDRGALERLRGQPEVVVCLGATAAKALISPSFRITKERGQLIPWTPPGAGTLFAAADDEDAPHQTWMLATTHPSAILRTPDEARDAAYDALVADLRVVAHALA